MSEKYYTPDLSEFHPGFECEWLCGFPDWPVHTFGEEEVKWRPIVISEKHDFNWIKSKLNGYPNLRVKHLDEEDILSLAFKHDFNDDGEERPNLQNEHGYSKGYNLDTQEENEIFIILYHFPDGFMVIEKIFKCASSNVFCGFVKNKNVLKQLLSWI